jgi:hypothetical protein
MESLPLFYSVNIHGVTIANKRQIYSYEFVVLLIFFIYPFLKK